jgi:hypothetical protein
LDRDSNRVEVFEMVDSVADLHWLPTPSGGPRCRGSLVSRCRVLGVSFCSSLTVVLFLPRAGQRVEPKAGLDDPTLAPMLGGSFQEQSSIPLVGEFGKGMMSEKGVSASLGGFARPSCPRSVSGHSEIGRSEYTTALVRNPCTTPRQRSPPGHVPLGLVDCTHGVAVGLSIRSRDPD